MTVDHFMARVVDQPDKGLDLARRPGTGAQLVARRFGIGRTLDQLDNLVDRGKRHHQAGQYVGPLARLAKKIDGPSCHHFLAEVAEGGDHVLQPHLFGAAAVHRQHVDREAGLQACVPEQLVQHHIAGGITAHLDHDPHACAVGFVADVGNALDGFLAHQFADPLEKLRLVHLIGNFRDDDGLAVLAVGDDFGAGAHHYRAAPGRVGIADSGASHDQGAGREIGPGDDLDQLLDRDRGIADIGFARRDYFARIMRGNVGRHADGDAVRAIDQQVRIFGGKNRRLELGLVVVLGEIDSFLVDVTKQAFRRPCQPGFGVAHRRRRIAVNRAEIALPVDKRQAHREILGHADHGLIDRAVAMRVIVTHDITNDPRGFARRLRPVVIALHHRVENAAMDGFQAVAHIGKRPRHDHAHRVIEIGFAHLLGDGNRRAGWLGRRCRGVVQKGLLMPFWDRSRKGLQISVPITTSIPQERVKPQNIVRICLKTANPPPGSSDGL